MDKQNTRISTAGITLALATLVAASVVLAGCAGTAGQGSQAAGQDSSQATSQAAEQATAQTAAVKTISGEEAMQIMESETGYVIVDVRTPEEFASGHIPDAICIPVETIGNTAPAELPNMDQKILVYCRSGNRSAAAAAQLVALGYTDVIDFGGIINWTGEVVTD